MKEKDKEDHSNIALIKDEKNGHFPKVKGNSSIVPLNSAWFRNIITYSSGSFLFNSEDKEVNLTGLKTGMFSYIISSNKNEEVLKVKSNMLSNSFKVYSVKHQNKILLTVHYAFSILGMGGPIKLNIVLNNEDQSFSFINKNPVYYKQMNCYGLKFIERKILISSKNFQLVSEDDEEQENVLLQFGQCDSNSFFIDYKPPFNYLSAFAIAIIALSQKRLCE